MAQDKFWPETFLDSKGSADKAKYLSGNVKQAVECSEIIHSLLKRISETYYTNHSKI